jgi:hypothetical protein
VRQAVGPGKPIFFLFSWLRDWAHFSVFSDSVTNYLTKITQVHDQLGVVGEALTSVELVRVALNGFTKPWTSFIEYICAQEKLPDFKRLWDDCI